MRGYNKQYGYSTFQIPGPISRKMYRKYRGATQFLSTSRGVYSVINGITRRYTESTVLSLDAGTTFAHFDELEQKITRKEKI